MKTIIILGSTGSIGTNTLDIVQRFPNEFRVAGLTAGNNIDKLEEQIRAFAPRVVAVSQEAAAVTLRQRCAGLPVEVLSGEAGIAQVASLPEAELVISAIVGAAGLVPTLTAIRSGKHIALANKEPMVMAGKLMQEEAHKHGVRIFPVDSEHSALWQCVNGEVPGAIRRLILTASGGPFRTWDADRIAGVTVADALRHPTWQMGPKITIDSATLMNKGLEAIEAHWMFGVAFDRIDVAVHPTSIVHSLVEFIDGSAKAQLGWPDMRLPIQMALTRGARLLRRRDASDPASRPFSVIDVASLAFEAADMDRFPCLRLALDAGRTGGTAPAILSAADEIAVEAFLNGAIGFGDIARVVAGTLDDLEPTFVESLDQLLTIDVSARDTARERVRALSSRR